MSSPVENDLTAGVGFPDQDTMSQTLDQYFADLDEEMQLANMPSFDADLVTSEMIWPLELSEGSESECRKSRDELDNAAEETNEDEVISTDTHNMPAAILQPSNVNIQPACPQQDSDNAMPNTNSGLASATSEPQVSDPDTARYSISLRPVVNIENAYSLARQNRWDHDDAVDALVIKIGDRIDTLAYLIHGQQPVVEAKRALRRHVEQKIRDVQSHIEQSFGEYNHRQNNVIENAQGFDNRLLQILYLGLLRQEAASGRASQVLGLEAIDLNASCLLEARSWQLELFQKWADDIGREIENRRIN